MPNLLVVLEPEWQIMIIILLKLQQIMFSLSTIKMTPLTLYWCFSHFYSNQCRYTRHWLHRLNKWIHFHYVYKMTVQIGFEKQISFAQCTSSQISNPPPTSTPWVSNYRLFRCKYKACFTFNEQLLKQIYKDRDACRPWLWTSILITRFH